ncbi:MAG: hypothetical protein PSN04_08125, partial [Methyloprofundus sp.]|nr:hypothetical protein [Methyloprofundus sp.]
MSPILKKFTLYGFIFGLCFPLIAIMVDLQQNSLAFSINNIAQLFQQNLLHWVITTAPFILAGAAWLIGKERQTTEKNILQSFKTQNNDTHKANSFEKKIYKEIAQIYAEKSKFL